MRLENLATDIRILPFDACGTLFHSCFCQGLKFVESILAIFRLCAAGAGHPSHPVKLAAVEILGAGNAGVHGLHTFFALLQIVGVVAAIGIDGLAIEFEDDIADTFQEIAIVRHHEQGLATAAQVVLQPFYHADVKVVGWLVKH